MRKAYPNINIKDELNWCRRLLAKRDIAFTHDEIRGASREHHLGFIRSLVAISLAKKGFSYPQIGYIINRDHSAAIHLVLYYRSGNSRGEREIMNKRHALIEEWIISEAAIDRDKSIVLDIEASVKALREREERMGRIIEKRMAVLKKQEKTIADMERKLIYKINQAKKGRKDRRTARKNKLREFIRQK